VAQALLLAGIELWLANYLWALFAGKLNLVLDSGLQVDELDLYRLGPSCEKHAAFPAKINTEFVEILSRQHVRMVVWERGAGRTLACGTGACATVVAGRPSF